MFPDFLQLLIIIFSYDTTWSKNVFNLLIVQHTIFPQNWIRLGHEQIFRIVFWMELRLESLLGSRQESPQSEGCFFCTWNKQTSSFILLFSSLTLRRLTYYDLCFIYRFHVAFEHLIVCGMSTASGQLFFLQTVLSLLERASRYSASKIHNTYTYNECSKITCYIVVWLLNVIAQSFFVLLFSVVSSKDTLWRLWSCIVEHLNEHIQKVSSHLS